MNGKKLDCAQRIDTRWYVAVILQRCMTLRRYDPINQDRDDGKRYLEIGL